MAELRRNDQVPDRELIQAARKLYHNIKMENGLLVISFPAKPAETEQKFIRAALQRQQEAAQKIRQAADDANVLVKTQKTDGGQELTVNFSRSAENAPLACQNTKDRFLQSLKQQLRSGPGRSVG